MSTGQRCLGAGGSPEVTAAHPQALSQRPKRKGMVGLGQVEVHQHAGTLKHDICQSVSVTVNMILADLYGKPAMTSDILITLNLFI